MVFSRYRKVSDTLPSKASQPIFKRFSSKMVELVAWILFLSLFPVLGWMCIKKIKPNKALVQHRLGSEASVKYSGYAVVLPAIDTANEVNLSPQNIVIPPSLHYSKDRFFFESGLVVEYQIKDPIACVRELQDVDESVILASKAALPSVIAQNNSAMILCSKKLIEYAVVKNINNAVFLWGIEILSAELSPFKLANLAKETKSEGGMNSIINFIQKIAGHNPLPPKEKFSIDEMISSLKPYLTAEVGEKVSAVILMVLTGEHGGNCLIDFKTCTMVANPATCHPDVTIEIGVETLITMIDNRSDLRDMYKSGKVKITGDVDVAWRLRHLF